MAQKIVKKSKNDNNPNEKSKQAFAASNDEHSDYVDVKTVSKSGHEYNTRIVLLA